MLVPGISISTGIVPANFGMFQAMPYFFHGMGLFLVMLIAIITGWGREYKTEEIIKEEKAIMGE